MYNFQNPKYFRRVLVIGLVGLFFYAMNDEGDLAKCMEKMSEQVCINSLYP